MHPNLSVTFAAIPQSAADLSFDLGDFAATSATVTGTTAKGRDLLAAVFGAGCVSFTLPKSKADDFARFAASCGVRS